MPGRHHRCPPRVRSNLVPGECHPRPACGLRCCRLPEQGGYPPGSGQSRGLCRAGYSYSSISLPTARRRSSRQVSEGSDPRRLPAGRLASPPAAEARHPALLLSSWERELLPHRASASADVSRLKIAQAGSPADLSAQVTGAIQTPCAEHSGCSTRSAHGSRRSWGRAGQWHHHAFTLRSNPALF